MTPKPGPIMTSDSVRKTREGVKTMTSRVFDHPIPEGWSEAYTSVAPYCTGSPNLGFSFYRRRGDGCWESNGRFHLPYKVGEIYYVREAVVTHSSIQQVNGYVADGCYVSEGWEKLRSARHMPKWAARTFIEIKGIHIRKLHQMTERDYIDEGCPNDYLLGLNWWKPHWDSINKRRGFPWDSNPWVSSYRYRLVEGR